MAEAFLLQQGHTREKLMEEAMHIQRIIPERNIDEIYSSLETFFDDPKRVQRVVLKFLDHVREDKDTAGEATEELPKRARKRIYDADHNQPSTSGIPPKKPSKINVKSDASEDNKTENVGVSTHSDSRPAESDKVTIADGLDVVLDQCNLVNRSDSVSDVSSESDKFNEIKEYLWENEGFAFSSEDEPELSDPDVMDPSSEPVKNVDSRQRDEVSNEPSTSFWDPTVPRHTGNGNHKNTLDRNLPVDLTLPGPSTANYDDLLAPPQLDDSDVVCIDINGVDDEKKQAYYNSLIEIFPDAQKDFLRAICDKCSQDADWLSNAISGLLENGYPKAADSSEREGEQAANQKLSGRTEEEKKMIIDENYTNLLAIFPNADPTYIRETCEQIADDEDAMKKFVSDTLESGKYPTLAEYEERMKVMEIREKYLKNFKIEEFLEIFPDPFKYFFEEKKNDEKESELSLNYLKSRYRKIRIVVLQEYLMKNKYSLTKACAELDKCRNFMKSKRGEHEIQYNEKDMKNIPFMQEVAFIENKEKIRKYLNEKELKRVKSFKKAKENNESECGCCYDDEVLAEDTVTCIEGHIFCKTCLQKYAETQIGDGKTIFTCLSNCDAEFSLKMLQGVLRPSVFSKMLQRKQIEEVKSAAIPGLEVCPFCDFASIPPEEDKIFRCLNPECMKESCRKCKELSHIPLRCEEVEKPEEVKIRTYIEDRMTQALIRTCWRCEKKFIKIDGCNKMTCTCGALMCYICRKPVKDYTHFNGEGGTEYHKCPLFSKNDDLHVKAVEEEAAKARNEALAKNPNIQLKHDPTHILPERTQPDVPDRHNVHFVPYNGRYPVHVNLHLPAGAAEILPARRHHNVHPPPGGAAELNWLNPVIAVGQQRFMVAQGPHIVVEGPRHGARLIVPPGIDNGPEAQGQQDRPAVRLIVPPRFDNGPEAQGQRDRPVERVPLARPPVGQGQQVVAMAQAVVAAAVHQQHARMIELTHGHRARAAEAAHGQRARAAEAAHVQRARAAEAAHGQRARVAEAAHSQRARAVEAAHGQRARVAEAAHGQRDRAAEAAHGQRDRVVEAAHAQRPKGATQRHQVMLVASAGGAQALQAWQGAQGQQVRLAAAQGQQAMPAAAQGQQAMPAAAQGQQAMPAAAQRQQAMPAAAQGQQAMPTAAQEQQAVPAAAQGQQARPVVPHRLVRRAAEAQRGSPVAHLLLARVQRQLPPPAEGQPAAQLEVPLVNHPPLAADDFVAQWLAAIPPQLEIPVAQDQQRPQEPLPH
ncbi:LOW QUALITY PROTEIN: uncharacterized protein LOC126276571 [Schistocerca gregaria]|uniref:LOW QUALITY PROTEIN: uncharacterized protein LOC126276571 n=1 Tax=Schistocerca gregaria TaxID=7010 RepID=UPI00211EAAB0|nr:LOW QUALITY PROTEIN: uncharacterized protein LOC126276571 [Schistocerca gregaria]